LSAGRGASRITQMGEISLYVPLSRRTQPPD
jgi:hypothetical protein